VAGGDRSNLFSQHNEIASPPSAARNDKCDIVELAISSPTTQFGTLGYSQNLTKGRHFLHFSDRGGTFLALNPSRTWKANQVNADRPG